MGVNCCVNPRNRDTVTGMIVDPLMRLRLLVKNHGSQRAVARHLGVSASLLSDWLLERRPVPDSLLTKLRLRRVIVSMRHV